MGKKSTLFGLSLLLGSAMLSASPLELPTPDSRYREAMQQDVNTKHLLRSRKNAHNPFAETALHRNFAQKKTNPFSIKQFASGTSNLQGLQVYNTANIYDTWWQFDVATAQSTSLWSNYLLSEYDFNTGWVEDNMIYAVAVEAGYILKFDLVTGEYQGYIAMGGYDYSTSILHSTYDAESDKVYVYTYDAGGDGLLFQSYDPDAKEFKLIKSEVGTGTLADDPLVTMAINPLDGYIYAITLYNEKWIKIDPATGNYEEIAKLEFSPAYYTQAMVYSPNDKAFVYVGIDTEDYTYRLLIDPSTGDIIGEQNMNDDAEYSILYCADQAVQDNAPAAPEIQSITFNDSFTIGTASILMPSTTSVGAELTGTLTLNVSIDDVLFGTYTTSPGKTEEVTLENVSEGVHTMKVQCLSGNYKSAYVEQTFFVGVDSPATPQNVVLTETLVSWDAVTQSANGGILESTEITYNVYINGVKENQVPITDTSYPITIDASSIKKVQAEVEAVCGSKVSGRALSNILAVGTYAIPLELPVTQDVMQFITIVDANNDGTTWGWCGEHNAFEYNYSEYNDADDWAIFHKTTFPKSKQLYRIDVDVTRYSSYPEKFEIGISKTGNVEDMMIVVPEVTLEAYNQVEGLYGAQFKLEEAGDYFIGVRATSERDNYYLRLNKLCVTMAEAPTTVPEACTDATATAADFGRLEATVEVTLPTLALNGEALDAEKELTLTVSSNVGEGKATGKPGERVSAKVATEQGTNILRIIPENEYGIGTESTVSVYTGVDVPAQPVLTSLSVSKDNRTMTFSWETSTTGANGGFVDPAFVTYQILIYYEPSDYWFSEAGPGYDGTQYSYTVPEGTPLQAVRLAVTSQNVAGVMSEGPIVTATLGTPYSVPMEEKFTNLETKYYPLTIEHPAEEYSGSWTVANPTDYVFGSENEEEASLVGFATSEGETYAQLALPKFTAKNQDGVKVELDAYLYDGMAEAVVYVRGHEGEALPLGTISRGDENEDWKRFEFILPEEVLGWEWAELVIRASFTKAGEYLLIGRYALSPYTGIEKNLATSEISIYSERGAVIATGVAAGDLLEVFSIDGRLVAARRAEENIVKISLYPGIYMTRCGSATAKVVVR